MVYILITEHAYVPGARVHAFKTHKARLTRRKELRREFGNDVSFEMYETVLEG